jgi:hypothetical protein
MNNTQKALIYGNQNGFGASLTGTVDVKKLPFKSFNQARSWLSNMTGDWHSKVTFVHAR